MKENRRKTRRKRFFFLVRCVSNRFFDVLITFGFPTIKRTYVVIHVNLKRARAPVSISNRVVIRLDKKKKKEPIIRFDETRMFFGTPVIGLPLDRWGERDINIRKRVR